MKRIVFTSLVNDITTVLKSMYDPTAVISETPTLLPYCSRDSIQEPFICISICLNAIQFPLLTEQVFISTSNSPSSPKKSLLLNLRNFCSRSQQGNERKEDKSSKDLFCLLMKQLTRCSRCFNGVLVTHRSKRN